jgi:hypothetical protein
MANTKVKQPRIEVVIPNKVARRMPAFKEQLRHRGHTSSTSFFGRLRSVFGGDYFR